VPTIFEQDGYRVKVFIRNEHRPPHVHVERAGAYIAVLISLAGAEYRDSAGRKPTEREIRRAVAIVRARLQECLFAWNRYHA
jgi:Domain of unknown function (DUF4160)